MKNFNTVFYVLCFSFVFLLTNDVFTQNENNSFLFNNQLNAAYVLDNSPILPTDADETGFQYFNKIGESNKNISVEAWVYLIGDNQGIKMPIIYRSLNDGSETFSLYVKDNKAYFAAAGSELSSPNDLRLNAFTWIHLVGIHDGDNDLLKLYVDGDLVSTASISSSDPLYPTDQGKGLYIGKSDEGQLNGLLDEVRLWNFVLPDNNINGSGGNGNPSENYPNSIEEYLVGRWSFTEVSNFNGERALEDLSVSYNHLRLFDDQYTIINSKNIPFLVVNSRGDDPDEIPGDGIASTPSGNTTFRSAIQESNALEGEQLIFFYIPGAAPYVISPNNPLPAITDRVSLITSTQTGYSGDPIIQIDGINAGEADGLVISAGGIELNGFQIYNFFKNGISLTTNGNNSIDNNIISSNGTGILIGNGSSNNSIGSSIGNITNANGLGISVQGEGFNTVFRNKIMSIMGLFQILILQVH